MNSKVVYLLMMLFGVYLIVSDWPIGGFKILVGFVSLVVGAWRYLTTQRHPE